MKKLKLFIENILIYGLGGIIGKFIPFIMLPVVTRLMPDTSYFGISDLSNTMVSFGSAIAIMGMYDAMYRLFFDKEDTRYKISICSTALSVTFIMSFIMCILIIFFRKQLSKGIFGDIAYQHLAVITALSILFGASNTIVAAPTRMQNKKGVYLATNLISPLLSYSIVIPLLLTHHYLIALPLAHLIASASMTIVFWGMNRCWFSLKNFNRREIKNLLKLGVPLMPSFLLYWVFGSCDKLMIMEIIGAKANGIYSVGAKIGSISQLIYIAFTGGWQYFAFSTMNEDNQVETNSKIFEYLGAISFSAAMIICAVSKNFFEIFFVGDYQKGYIVAPFLFMSPLLQMLFQVIGNQFLVIKKTGPNALFLSVGAITNVLLNWILIHLIGIEGAALATVTGYIVSLMLSMIVLSSMKQLVISYRFYISVILTVFYYIIWRFRYREQFILPLIIAFTCIGIIVFLYRNDIALMFNCINAARKDMKKENSI